MRATVSPDVGGLKVHAFPSLDAKLIDELEPGFVVDVMERNPERAPNMSRITYTRYLKSGPAAYEGWSATSKLVFAPPRKKPAPPSPPSRGYDLDLGLSIMSMWPVWLVVAMIIAGALVAYWAR